MSGLVSTSWLALVRRRARTALLSSGIVLGVAAFATTVLVASSARSAVGDTFDLLKATTVTLSFPAAVRSPTPEDLQRLRRVDGVVHAGLFSPGQDPIPVSRLPPGLVAPADEQAVSFPGVTVYGDREGADALGLRLLAGRWMDVGASGGRTCVGLLEESLAQRVGVPATTAGWTGHQSVWVGGRRCLMLGVYRSPDAAGLGAVLRPWAARPATQPGQVVVRTKAGAADLVAEQSPRVVSLGQPDSFVAAVAAEPVNLRRRVDSDLGALYLGLGGLSVAIGSLTAANAMFVSVFERRSEIGLRRAVGGSRRAIAGQFLLESVLLGLFGGVVGGVLSLDLVAAVCFAKGWRLTLDPIVPLLCPALGAAMGLLGGGIPALKAARIAPAETLRST
jgi:putative ABC transport system permease protein